MTELAYKRYVAVAVFLVAAFFGWRLAQNAMWGPALSTNAEPAESATFPVTKTDEEWRQLLTPEQYRILRQKGTEQPYSSPLNDEKRAGTYVSAGCGTALFRSEDKFDSGTGWPSFTKPISEDALRLEEDRSLPWAVRTEVLDATCGGHLGHVFEDGPPPTGLRYCMNGAALIFIPDGDDASLGH